MDRTTTCILTSFLFFSFSTKASVGAMEVCKRPAQIYENANLTTVPANFAGVMTQAAAPSNLNITLNNQLNAALHNQVSGPCFSLVCSYHLWYLFIEPGGTESSSSAFNLHSYWNCWCLVDEDMKTADYQVVSILTLLSVSNCFFWDRCLTFGICS